MPDMKRREFITLLGGAAAWPVGVRAQQPAKVPRVGILSPAASETAATLTAFREGIRDLGYVERETIAFDFRLSNGISARKRALPPGSLNCKAPLRRTPRWPSRHGHSRRGRFAPGRNAPHAARDRLVASPRLRSAAA